MTAEIRRLLDVFSNERYFSKIHFAIYLALLVGGPMSAYELASFLGYSTNYIRSAANFMNYVFKIIEVDRSHKPFEYRTKP